MSTLQLGSITSTRFFNACRATRPIGTNHIRISPRANDDEDDPFSQSSIIVAGASEKLVKLKFKNLGLR